MAQNSKIDRSVVFEVIDWNKFRAKLDPIWCSPELHRQGQFGSFLFLKLSRRNAYVFFEGGIECSFGIETSFKSNPNHAEVAMLFRNE